MIPHAFSFFQISVDDGTVDLSDMLQIAHVIMFVTGGSCMSAGALNIHVLTLEYIIVTGSISFRATSSDQLIYKPLEFFFTCACPLVETKIYQWPRPIIAILLLS